jgi:hypothetical protein
MDNHENDSSYIQYVRSYKVVNGHIIQLKCVGISTEYTFVVPKGGDLGLEITNAITKTLKEKQ